MSGFSLTCLLKLQQSTAWLKCHVIGIGDKIQSVGCKTYACSWSTMSLAAGFFKVFKNSAKSAALLVGDFADFTSAGFFDSICIPLAE